MAEDEPLPSVDALQFQKAETGAPADGGSCAACGAPIEGQFFKVKDRRICPNCASLIQARNAVNAGISAQALLYGAGAAAAGCALYAAVMAMGVQIGIVALAVGWMVGRAIRKATKGFGSRSLQYVAVALTYFAISSSYVVVLMFELARRTPPMRITIPGMIELTAIAPFLEIADSPVGGLISLFILFIGLQRAWVLTGKHEILVSGPHN